MVVCRRNVRKVFPKPDNLSGSKKKVALDGVSLQMFEGQIFGLLGHNGAGKSTLVSILSGLFSQTSGSVTAFGYDSATSMNDLRSIMGVCPQQNILFDELTVQEHLVVFAGFKGNVLLYFFNFTFNFFFFPPHCQAFQRTSLMPRCSAFCARATSLSRHRSAP